MAALLSLLQQGQVAQGALLMGAFEALAGAFFAAQALWCAATDPPQKSGQPRSPGRRKFMRR